MKIMEKILVTVNLKDQIGNDKNNNCIEER
jgi:hypothetical protein